MNIPTLPGTIVLAVAGTIVASLLIAADATAAGATGDQGDMRIRTPLAQPVFRVVTEGDRGNTVLKTIDFGGGMAFTKFIHAERVTDFYSPGGQKTRIVRGANSTIGPDPLTVGDTREPTDDLRNTAFGADISPQAKADFEQALAEVMQNTNLNSFLDNGWTRGKDPVFSFVVHLEKPLKDNDPELDNIGEIIFFERGSSTANSFIVVTALDENGDALGEPYLVHPDYPVATTPRAWVGSFNNNLSQRGSQEMGGVSIDLSSLGVLEASSFRIQNATIGENGLTSAMIYGGRDRNPDFKLIFVQTYDIALPSWMIGD